MKPVLDSTVALVTGASSGIGAATAAALAAQGAAVALAARRGDRLEALAAGIRDQGGTALVLECDITDEQQAAGDLPRAFRTADLWLIHAADCCSRYSSWTCCGVRY